MAVAAAGVTGLFTVGSLLAQIYMTNQAKEESRSEARRTERLAIGSAREETARLRGEFKESMAEKKRQFDKSLDFSEKQFASSEEQRKFQNTQAVIDRLVNNFDRNLSARRNLANQFRMRSKF